MRNVILFSTSIVCLFMLAACTPARMAKRELPDAGEVVVNREGAEVILQAVIQHPEDKPCIDSWGQRPQAFAGCKYAGEGDAKYADFFVFLVAVPTEKVYEALLELGAKPEVHYTIPEANERSGLNKDTKPEDYLQGSPVVISIFWKEGDKWREEPYEYFVDEKVTVEGGEVIKPWTPHFEFHGSGAIHSSGTGCIACPCDCPGGIIADNRFPVYNPKPVVRFSTDRTPPEGSVVYVRIRPVCDMPE